MLESKSYIATPPGATIKEPLDDRGMTQKEFAGRMGVSEKHVSKLLGGAVHLTPDMAERLELVLGIPAGFWNKLEAIYQEKLVKVKKEIELEKEKDLASKYPYAKIAKWGMVPSTQNICERIVNLCKYFEVSNLKLVQNKDLMPVFCRKLSDTEKSTFAMLTLAQYAKIKAREMDVSPFKLENLKRKIKAIRALTTHQTMDFETELVEMLRDCGVALVFLPKLQGSFLHGISFYDNNTKKVVVGISMRGKYADRFWFSLFHELAHIILGHIYEINGTTDADETAADVMAAEILIPKKEIMEFYERHSFSLMSIKAFAAAIGTNEGIVIGRLQNDKRILPSQFNQYKVKFEEVA